jgi:non-heme chloroperoxidase
MSLVKVANNTNLYYKDWGTGRTVAFVHGWCVNCDSWEYMMMDMVVAGFRCVAFDMRGCGRSDQPNSGYDYATLAHDLAGVIKGLGLEKIVLVGHSMGCGVITQYLADYGDGNVEKAVFIGPTTPFCAKTEENPDGIDPELFNQAVQLLKKDRPAYVRSLVDGFFYLQNPACTVSADMADWAVDITLQASAIAALGLFKTNIFTDQRSQLKKIQIPVLILNGDKDVSTTVDRNAKPTHQLITNSTLKIFKDQAHGMYISEAALLTPEIIEFINK